LDSNTEGFESIEFDIPLYESLVLSRQNSILKWKKWRKSNLTSRLEKLQRRLYSRAADIRDNVALWFPPSAACVVALHTATSLRATDGPQLPEWCHYDIWHKRVNSEDMQQLSTWAII